MVAEPEINSDACPTFKATPYFFIYFLSLLFISYIYYKVQGPVTGQELFLQWTGSSSWYCMD